MFVWRRRMKKGCWREEGKKGRRGRGKGKGKGKEGREEGRVFGEKPPGIYHRLTFVNTIAQVFRIRGIAASTQTPLPPPSSLHTSQPHNRTQQPGQPTSSLSNTWRSPRPLCPPVAHRRGEPLGAAGRAEPE